MRKEVLKKLAIGIPTVSTRDSNYLLNTLESLFSNVSAEHLDEIVVVIVDADLGDEESVFLDEVRERFSREIEDERIVIYRTKEEDYPPLPPIEVDAYKHWYSKQTIDYAIAIELSATLGENVLQLEDDIKAAPNFYPRIINDIDLLKSINWAAIRTCNWATIGTLFKSEDVPEMTKKMRELYQEMPVDWIQREYFIEQVRQRRWVPMPNRSLFQHVGVKSSFQSPERTYEIEPPDFDQFCIHDLSFGPFSFIFRPLSRLYFLLKSQIIMRSHLREAYCKKL